MSGRIDEIIEREVFDPHPGSCLATPLPHAGEGPGVRASTDTVSGNLAWISTKYLAEEN
jgi:hypothetical protein